MARARNIKPALFKNEVLGSSDPLLTILFAGLWTLADREGRLEDRPARIRVEILPYREGVDVGALLDQLQAHGFITRYVVEGNRFIEITKFVQHQNPHRNEPISSIPKPPSGVSQNGHVPSGSAKIGTAPEFGGRTPDKLGTAPADSLLLIPDPLNPQTPLTPRGGEPASPDYCTIVESTKSPDPALPPSPVEMGGNQPAGSRTNARRRKAQKPPPDEGPGFAEFYAAYPRKVERDKAARSWNDIGPDEDLRAKILADVRRRLQSDDWRKENGKYIPHPATFLNNRRWTDEGVHLPPSDPSAGPADREAERTRRDGQQVLENLRKHQEEVSRRKRDQEAIPG